MNVFRSRKKSISEAETPRPSIDNAPPLPKQSRNLFSRKRVPQEIKKEEIILADVLPSDNEFRTSLLMPNLAQRFSMLREQDDPSTKIGKASDDSVLFPKRASRLDVFGLGNLDDIVEVASITGSFRPPFAQDGRTNSYASDGFDGYASDTGSANGSVMSRSRPGQGNKLFGGRQKVYKIPTNGPASKSSSRPGSSGNATTSGSASVKRGMGKAVYDDDISLSHWQRFRAEDKAKRSFDYDYTDANIDGRLSPVSSGYNRNRETASSTNSNERTSTAATSMTSVFDGSTTSLSAMMTKEPVRDRPLNKRMYGHGIDQQVHEQQNSAAHRLNSVRGGRQLGGSSGSKTGQRAGAVSAASSLRSGSPSPALNSATGFDFGLERPTQLNTRDTDSGYHGPSAVPSPISPPVVSDSALAAHIDPNDHGKATASGAFNKPKARYDDQQYAQRQLQLREGRDTSQGSNSRSQTPSDGTASRLRKNSDSSIGRGNSSRNFSRVQGDRSMSRGSNNNYISSQSRSGTYSVEASDSEDSGSARYHRSNSSGQQAAQPPYDQSRSPNLGASYPFEDQHPALRGPITEEDESVHDDSHLKPYLSSHSQNLGPTSGGLSDMVRGHLRHQSDASSVYSDTVGYQSAGHSYHNSISEPLTEQVEPVQVPRTAPQIPTQEAMLRERAISATRGAAAFHQYRDDSASHTRSPSNDTLLERDAFADELADRRRQVEEKLRNIAESRADIESENPSKAFGLLRKSTSRTSLANDNSSGRGLKKFISGSGNATPTEHDGTDYSPPRRPTVSRNTSDISQQDGSGRTGPKSPLRDRDIGAERRARHAAQMHSPRGTGPPAPRGQVEARKQQFAGAAGPITRDFTERVVSNPDQGKPHFHPAGRARHYSPPRSNNTPDQKPHLPPAATRDAIRATSRSASRTRPERPLGSERANITSPGSQGRSHGKDSSTDGFNSRGFNGADTDSPQMVTPGTFPPPANAQYAQARKRSVSKADISSPVSLVSSTYEHATVDLSPGASLENGMDEVRAADGRVPPVPPINPRRRAMGGFKKSGRGTACSNESDEEGRQSPQLGLRKQQSEGTNLRGRIRERIAMPTSPPRGGYVA